MGLKQSVLFREKALLGFNCQEEEEVIFFLVCWGVDLYFFPEIMFYLMQLNN